MHFIKDPKQEPNAKWIAGWIKGLPVLSNNEISSCLVVSALSKCCYTFSFVLNFALSLAILFEKRKKERKKVFCISQKFSRFMLPDRKWFLAGKFPQGVQNENPMPPKKEGTFKSGKHIEMMMENI